MLIVVVYLRHVAASFAPSYMLSVVSRKIINVRMFVQTVHSSLPVEKKLDYVCIVRLFL